MDKDRYLIRPSDTCYPELLKDLERAPELYVLGDPDILGTETISIVGARRATPYGLAVSEMAARISAECSLTVVSGGARGCDHAASRSALDAGGRTIIVSGVGADLVYPPDSADIFFDAVERGGAIVSLERWGTDVRRHQFPKRNRIIAALSRSLFVAEAGLRSGTMSTAEAAAELCRRLYAVPGSIFSPASSGSNSLIRSGADIICDERDLEQVISSDYGVLRCVTHRTGRPCGDVLSALLASPLRPQELAERLNKDVLTLIKTLSEYEVLGMVVKLPDGRYAPSKDAYLSHNRGGGIRDS